MNPFKLRTLDRYSPAVIRLLLGTAELAAACIARGAVASSESLILHILHLALCLFGLMNLFAALFEMLIVFANRKHQRLLEMPADEVRTLEYRLFPAEKVLSALEQDPVLSLRIISGDRLLLVGSASDCREVHDSMFKSHTEFFDKAYFVNDDEYLSFDAFCAALAPHIQSGSIAVHKVDDILISKYHDDLFDE
jgi:hypothetical protein